MEKDGETTITFPKNHLSLRDGYLLLPKKVGRFKVRHALSCDARIKLVRIVPTGAGYTAEIVYEKEMADPKPVCCGPVVGIDLGVENIVAVASSAKTVPWIVKGGAVKSANQYYNKTLARLRSICEKAGVRTTKRIKRLTSKRNRIIKNALHHISRRVVDYAKKIGARAIAIGRNPFWNNGCGLGKRANQSFVQIPHYVLVEQIRYKADEAGIPVVTTEESYTSRCSFLDGEPLGRRDSYKGMRVRRGLFVSHGGIAINADVNAAYNIIRKVFPEEFSEGIEDVSLHPVRADVFCACE